MNADSFEVAWCAGLFEGEGCICWNTYRYPGNGKTYGYLRLRLDLTDEDVLVRYAAILEGKTTGPYDPGEGRKPKWTWTEGRQKQVGIILNAFWPYLGRRRRARAVELGFTPADQKEQKVPSHCSPVRKEGESDGQERAGPAGRPVPAGAQGEDRSQAEGR